MPYGLILQTARLAGDDAIVTTDVGQHQMWTAQAYPFRRPRQLLTSGGLGTMGFGLPAAIGAALACPDRTVVCFSGDGSLLMNIQELVTAVEEDVNVKVVVLNNNSLGLVHQQQELFYGKRFFASDFRSSVDFAQVARRIRHAGLRSGCGRRSCGHVGRGDLLSGSVPDSCPDRRERVCVPHGAARRRKPRYDGRRSQC